MALISEAEKALALVQERAEESGVPFSQVASVYLLEEVLYVVAQSFQGRSFVLRNRSDLSFTSWRERVCHRLSFYYIGA